MAIESKMHGLALVVLIVQLTVAGMLCGASSNAAAQSIFGPEFLERHFRYEATDAKDGPKLNTNFQYSPNDTLITRSSLKLKQNGFEQTTALGGMQNFGNVKTALTYNMHRFNYNESTRERDDVTFDLKYRSVRFQHRFEEDSQVSTVGLPISLKSARFDLSYTQTSRNGSATTTDVYKLVSRVQRLKISATWKETPRYSWADYDAEYRPSGRWLLKYAYADHGQLKRREVRGEYDAGGFRLTSECKARSFNGGEIQLASAFGIERTTKLAAVKLNVEYSDLIDTPTVSLKLESRALF